MPKAETERLQITCNLPKMIQVESGPEVRQSDSSLYSTIVLHTSMGFVLEVLIMMAMSFAPILTYVESQLLYFWLHDLSLIHI